MFIRIFAILNAVMLFFTLPANAENTAPQSAPRFKLYFNQDKSLCGAIDKILNAPENAKFVGGSEDYNAITSEFTLPKTYQSQFQWVKWKLLPPATKEFLDEYFKSKKKKEWLLGLNPANDSLFDFYQTNLPLKDLDGKKEYKLPLLMAHGQNPMLAKRYCYISDKKPNPLLSPEGVFYFNEGEPQGEVRHIMNNWCGFFRYNGETYKANWHQRGLDFLIQRISLDAQEKKIRLAHICLFTFHNY